MISVMEGDKEERVAFTRTVRRGSSLQVEDFDFEFGCVNEKFHLLRVR